MKYRVMASDGTEEDFDTEVEARILFDKKKATRFLRRKLSCNIHRCFHDEIPVRSCEIIEIVRAEI